MIYIDNIDLSISESDLILSFYPNNCSYYYSKLILMIFFKFNEIVSKNLLKKILCLKRKRRF